MKNLLYTGIRSGFSLCLVLILHVSCSQKPDTQVRHSYTQSPAFSITDSYKVTDLHPPIVEGLVPHCHLPEVKRPTQEMLEAYKDANKYGIWIDDKRISNSELSQYNVDDFEYYMVNGLEHNAAYYGLNEYQVTLLTPEGFRKFRTSLLMSQGELRVI